MNYLEIETRILLLGRFRFARIDTAGAVDE
jgi:hypothetical protein